MEAPQQPGDRRGAPQDASTSGGPRWSWASVVFLAMETSWLHAAILVASSPLALRGDDAQVAPALSLAGVALLLGGAYALGVALKRSSLDFTQARVAQALAALLAITVVVTWETGDGATGLAWPIALMVGDLGAVASGAEGPRRLLGLLMGALLWWRGTRLTSGVDVERVLFSFTLGVGAVTASLLVLQGRSAGSSQAPLALPFVALGLLALAAVHLERLGKEEGVLLRRYWLGLPALVAVATIGVGWVAARLVGGEPLAMLGVAGGLLRDALLWVAYPLLLALGLLAELLLNLLQLLTRNLMVNLEPPEFGGLVTELESQVRDPVMLPEWVGVVLRYALIVALVAAFVLLVAWALGGRGESKDEKGQEERESVFSASQLWRRLAGLLRRVFTSRGKGPRARARPGLAWEERSMRRLYRLVLAGAARRGVARRPVQTPDEFQRDLDGRLQWAEIRPVTAAFVASRYGGLHPTRERLRELERLWREVRRVGEGKRQKAKGQRQEPTGVQP